MINNECITLVSKILKVNKVEMEHYFQKQSSFNSLFDILIIHSKHIQIFKFEVELGLCLHVRQ